MRTSRKLHDVECDTDKQLHHRISDGIIEMGMHPVIYGVRIRAGYVFDKECHCWDWCCADDQLLIGYTYITMKTFLEAGVEFNELPHFSEIKPWNRDKHFAQKISNKLKEIGLPIMAMFISDILLEPDPHQK